MNKLKTLSKIVLALTLIIIFGNVYTPKADAAVTMTALTSGASDTDATSYTTASITPSANKLILVTIVNGVTSGTATIPTISGNGLTYVQVNTQVYGTSLRRVTVFRAMGASPTSGAITISFAGATQIKGRWSVVEFGNVDTTGTNGSGAVVQSVGVAGATTTSLSITLAAFGKASNATYGAAAANIVFNENITNGVGFTEIHDQGGASEADKAYTEWTSSNDTSVTASWTTSAARTGVAIEINAGLAPTITTPSNTSITSSGATLGGTVTSDGGAPIIGRGVCVGTSSNPAIGGTCFTTTGTTGIFTVNTTSLTPNTLYHYRAYATNSEGTSYTPDDTFTTPLGTPTISTQPTGTITATSAVLGGNITTQGESPVAARGICYSVTSANPNPQSGGVGVTCVPKGDTGIGVFSQTVSGLIPNTNTYSFTAYATNAQGTAYSTATTFTTLGPPSVSTSSAGNIGINFANLYSNINPNGASTNINYLWGTTNDSCDLLPNTLAGPAGLTGTSNISPNSATLSLLSPHTTYYFCAMATNTYGTTYGLVRTFKTSSTPGAYSFMDAASALGGGATDCNDGSEAPCPPPAPTLTSPSSTQINVSWSAGTGPAATSYNLEWCIDTDCIPSNLVTGVTSTYNDPGKLCYNDYGYRIIALNDFGSSEPSAISYKNTGNCSGGPTVSTNAATNIGPTSVMLNSTVTPNGGATAITYRYQATSTTVCSGTTPNTTIAGPTGLIGLDPLNGVTTQKLLTGLTEGTTYSFCATANNGSGPRYGTPSLQFTTSRTFYDTFTDTTGVLLENHTADTGGGWTKLLTVGAANTLNINTNTARTSSALTSSGAFYRTNGTAQDADYKVMVTLTSGSDTDNYNIIAGRVQDANNMYAAEFNNTQTRLYKKVSGTWTLLGTGAGIANGSIVTLNLNGTSIGVLDDGVVRTEAIDSSISAAGYAGIGLGGIINSSGDTSTAQILDDFEIKDIPVACTSNRYIDVDNDGYGAQGSSAGCFIAGVVNNTDCYDSNASAKPGQTTYFSTQRGDGSYDYNCVNGEERNSIYVNGTDTAVYTWGSGSPCNTWYYNGLACIALNPTCIWGTNDSTSDMGVDVTSSTACGTQIMFQRYLNSSCSSIDAGIGVWEHNGSYFYLTCK